MIDMSVAFGRFKVAVSLATESVARFGIAWRQMEYIHSVQDAMLLMVAEALEER